MPSTWPCTKWPPNSLPAVSGRSRFTRVPALISANEVRRSVSEERSAAKISPLISTMVRQQPFTAMLPDTASEAASGPACTRSRPPAVPVSRAPFSSASFPTALLSSASTRPTCSTIPVNIAEVSFHGEVGAEIFRANAGELAHAKRSRTFARRQARQRTTEPDERGCVEQANFLHHIGFESRLVEQRAGLEHHAQDIAAAQLFEHSLQVGAAAARAHVKNLSAMCAKIFGASARRTGAGKHQHVALRGANHLRLRAEPQPRIENYAQDRPPARQPAAIGEQRIIGKNRADAGHDRVRGVPHTVHLGARNFRGDPARLVSIA